jgi:hypothetical protein
MKTMLGIAAVVLSLVGTANVTFAQTSLGHGLITGSQSNEEENYGYPLPSQTYMWHSHRHHWHHSHSR